MSVPPHHRRLLPSVPLFGLLILALAVSRPHAAAAQTPARSRPATSKATAKTPAPAASPAKPVSEIDAARAALAAGRTDEAIETADRLLAKTPNDEAATGVKIAALVARDQRTDALAIYDAFRKATGHGSAALLAPVARGELRTLAHGDLSSLQGEALAALAADGDRPARLQLEQMAADTKKTMSGGMVSANEALARLGDARAAERLVAFASQVEPGRRTMVLGEIATVPHAPALALVRESLKSTDPMVQATAADAAGMLGLKPLEPELRQILATGHPFAQNSAAVALMRFGDAASKDRVRTLLTSPAGALRIQAARAFDAIGDRSWVSDVQPLLKDPDGVTRFQAAELLLPVDRPAALEVLQSGLADPNPAIRGEATRILMTDGHVDLGMLRTLLTDAAPRARLLAAGAVLTQARTPAPAAAPAAAHR
jgi:HEAT repeat protein